MSIAKANTHDLIPLNQAIREEIPTAVAISTVWRWATKGLAPATDGDPRIKLAVLYVGNRLHTTKAAIREFLELATKARLARIELKQQRCLEVSDQDLAAAGLL
jgi:hypothetical protein